MTLHLSSHRNRRLGPSGIAEKVRGCCLEPFGTQATSKTTMSSSGFPETFSASVLRACFPHSSLFNAWVSSMIGTCPRASFRTSDVLFCNSPTAHPIGSLAVFSKTPLPLKRPNSLRTLAYSFAQVILPVPGLPLKKAICHNAHQRLILFISTLVDTTELDQVLNRFLDPFPTDHFC